MAAAPALLESLGTCWALPDYVVACCFDRDGHLAFALGDGSLRLRAPGADSPLREVDAHSGACLSLAPAPDGGFLSGGDDGGFVRISRTGEIESLAKFPGRWVEHVQGHSGGLIACAAGRALHLFPRGKGPVVHEHASTIGGLSFSPDGQRIAVAHYGGISIRSTRHAGNDPQLLRWAGSHLGVTWSPNGRFLLSMMQENAIKGWRLEDKADLRMSGYQRKVGNWAWSDRGRYLVTSGADCAPCWPFLTRKGPIDQAPLTPGRRSGRLVTAVAGDPTRALIATGYDDGVVLLCLLDGQAPAMVKDATEGGISAMAVSADGRQLALGSECGLAGWLALPQ